MTLKEIDRGRNKCSVKYKKRYKSNSKYRRYIMILALIGYIGYKAIDIIPNLIKIPDEIENTDKMVIQILEEKANNNFKVAKILKNVDRYPKELLELASKNDELIDYVVDYPKYNSKINRYISIKDDYTKGEIPLFIQWDKRWGYDTYGSELMAINGCGPTSLAMVAVGLTGDTSINPKVVADFSENNGYSVNGSGSSWTLMSEGAKAFGLTPKELPLSEDIIINTLKKGQPIIAAMGKGTFTTTGHYLVLTGVDKNNKIIVNDSNSKIKSKQTWDIDIFMKETKNLWTFTSSINN